MPSLSPLGIGQLIIKGKSRGNGPACAIYLLKQEGREQVEIFDIVGAGAVGTTPQDLHQALLVMDDEAKQTKQGKQGLYHMQIAPQEGYDMTRDQWQRVIDVSLEELHMEGQAYAAVLHQDQEEGRTHMHLVIQRYDETTGQLLHMSKNYMHHERAARRLEYELGHELVVGSKNRAIMGQFKREGYGEVAEWMREAYFAQRPLRSKQYTYVEHQQAQRAQEDVATRKQLVTELWNSARDPQEFQKSLGEHGYVLAKGEKVPFVIVDRAGSSYNLRREILDTSVKTAQLKERLKDLVPTLQPSKEVEQQRKDQWLSQQAHENQKDRKTLLTRLWRETETGEGFKKAVQDYGFTLAQDDQRYVVVDNKGEAHNIDTSIRDKQVKAQQVSERFQDVAAPTLASVQLPYLSDRAHEDEQARKKFLVYAWQENPTGRGFRDVLAQHNFVLARDGDRHVVIDKTGEAHRLDQSNRRIHAQLHNVVAPDVELAQYQARERFAEEQKQKRITAQYLQRQEEQREAFKVAQAERLSFWQLASDPTQPKKADPIKAKEAEPVRGEYRLDSQPEAMKPRKAKGVFRSSTGVIDRMVSRGFSNLIDGIVIELSRVGDDPATTLAPKSREQEQPTPEPSGLGADRVEKRKQEQEERERLEREKREHEEEMKRRDRRNFMNREREPGRGYYHEI